MSGAAKAMIIVINSGSSSVKFAAFDCAGLQGLLTGEIENIGHSTRLHSSRRDGQLVPEMVWPETGDSSQCHATALLRLFEWLEQQLPNYRVQAVSHRVVHGGAQFKQPVLVTPALVEQLDALSPLAPLHQPHNLAAIRAIADLDPQLPQIACFDTAFHADQDWVMRAYALPQQIRERGVMRYGFHGLSYEYIAGVLPEHLKVQSEGRIIVAHLGNGASLCALRGRRSVATTMGFSALDGLVMGTRCGSLDPGVVLYLLQGLKMEPAQVESLLYRDSGLLGVSGISSDMRELQASDAPQARAAIDLFVNRVTREIGGLAAMLGGLDALVFTAGIGEHSALIRERVCMDAEWLGLQLDVAANRANAGCISMASSRVSAWVIPTNEELMLARHAQALLSGAAA